MTLQPRRKRKRRIKKRAEVISAVLMVKIRGFFCRYARKYRGFLPGWSKIEEALWHAAKGPKLHCTKYLAVYDLQIDKNALTVARQTCREQERKGLSPKRSCRDDRASSEGGVARKSSKGYTTAILSPEKG